MMSYISYAFAFLFLGYACYTDIRWFTISNRLSVLTCLTGIALYTLRLDFSGLLKACLTALLLFIVLFLLYCAKGIGAGDVKFLAGLSFLLPAGQLWIILLYAFLFAGLISLAVYSYKFIIKLSHKLSEEQLSRLLSRLKVKVKVKGLTGSSLLQLHHIPFMIAVFPAFLLDFYVEVLL